MQPSPWAAAPWTDCSKEYDPLDPLCAKIIENINAHTVFPLSQGATEHNKNWTMVSEIQRKKTTGEWKTVRWSRVTDFEHFVKQCSFVKMADCYLVVTHQKRHYVLC